MRYEQPGDVIFFSTKMNTFGRSSKTAADKQGKRTIDQLVVLEKIPKYCSRVAMHIMAMLISFKGIPSTRFGTPERSGKAWMANTTASVK